MESKTASQINQDSQIQYLKKFLQRKYAILWVSNQKEIDENDWRLCLQSIDLLEKVDLKLNVTLNEDLKGIDLNHLSFIENFRIKIPHVRHYQSNIFE